MQNRHIVFRVSLNDRSTGLEPTANMKGFIMDEKIRLLLQSALSHIEHALKDIDKILGSDMSSVPELGLPVGDIHADLGYIQKALTSLIQESE